MEMSINIFMFFIFIVFKGSNVRLILLVYFECNLMDLKNWNRIIYIDKELRKYYKFMINLMYVL